MSQYSLYHTRSARTNTKTKEQTGKEEKKERVEEREQREGGGGSGDAGGDQQRAVGTTTALHRLREKNKERKR